MSIGFDVLKETNGVIAYQNKKHTLVEHSPLFRDTDWDADIDRSKNRVLTGATGVYTFLDGFISAREQFLCIYIV